MNRFAILGVVLLLLLSAVPPASPAAAADEELNDLAARLIALRGEVQGLNNRLEDAMAAHRVRMQSLERQRGELEAQIKRDRLHLNKLESTLRENREAAERTGADADRLRPVLDEVMAAARKRVRTGLPFKTGDRLAALDEIEHKLAGAAITPYEAAGRLWAFLEDELRLTRENGIYRQPVTVAGEEKLADVARLGMVMLFFETVDGQFGAARRGDDGWRFEVFNDRRAADQVALLFDNLGKQIRTGWFTLPNVLPGEVQQ